MHNRPVARSDQSTTPARPSAALPRRGFMTRLWAVLVGGFILLVPAASSLALFLDPLRRRSAKAGFLRVATLSALPDDGVPRQFAVVGERIDAWNRSREPLGAVYLRRQSGQEQPECLSAICPHAGCFVAYDAELDQFKCPCHNSCFALDGAIVPPSPSPRAMDSLECKVEADEILVQYENFYTGKADKVAKA
jgi:Rieske Fe-S protein